METNNLIIGGGFSSAIAKLFLKNFKLISASNHKIIKKEFYRRKNIEFNKLFQKKSYSYGMLRYQLKNIILHDRVILGGNSNIWGGKIDLKKIPPKIINFLKKNKIVFKKISFFETGTTSNNKNIAQLQNLKGDILNVSDFPIKFKKGYLVKFISRKNYILSYIKFNDTTVKKTKVKKLFLCLGPLQLIDLLYRSGYLKNNDLITISEFRHVFKFRLKNSNFEKDATTVRYSFARGLGHLFGIQKYTTILKILKFVPIVIDQIFYKKKILCKLHLKNGLIVGNKKKIYSNYKFGESIHYCNLKINNIKIDQFLNKINKNLIGSGMAFLDQKKPGPISNEIILDILKKIKLIKKNYINL